MNVYEINVGDAVIFTGTRPFWFADMVERTNRELEIGWEYTIRSKEILSSWTKITLVEMGESVYNLSWFEPARKKEKG